MSSAAEALTAPSQMASGLRQGVATISNAQEITFSLYARQVLPIDGWVFWVRQTNAAKSFAGSLHYNTDLEQNPDETLSHGRVVFTTSTQIQDFDQQSPNTLYIAIYGERKFAFRGQKNFYENAGLYHYYGDALYPAELDQILDDPTDVDLSDVVVSNSLPLWLSINQVVPIYPSHLVPQNLAPPYASIEIPETESLQAAPLLIYSGTGDNTQTDYQLCRDTVKIVIYGLRNNEALLFRDTVFNYTLNTDAMGIMNMPAIRDGKRVQTEMGIIAMQKLIEFEVSYYQSTAFETAIKLITSAFGNYTVLAT